MYCIYQIIYLLKSYLLYHCYIYFVLWDGFTLKIMSQKINNYNWSITSRREIDTNITNLWEIISSPSNLDLYHPFCLKNQVINWSKEKSIDRIIYLNGKTFERKFFNWVPNTGYDLKINQISKLDSLVKWRIYSVEDKSEIEIKVYPYVFNQGSIILNILPFTIFSKPLLTNYLDSVTLGLKYYAETGNVVSKNQFGKNIWFS